MPQSAVVNADGKKLEIKTILLINPETKKHIDLIKLFSSFEINESIENKFFTGSIIVNTEYDLREYIEMSGKEEIRIAWSSGDDFYMRDHTFKILNIVQQEEAQENVLETIKIEFVDERYLTMISNEPYNIFSGETASSILTTMFDELSITTNIESTTETFSYYWMKEFNQCLNEVRLANSDPLLVFQQNQGIIGKKISTLFNQTAIKFEFGILADKDKRRQLRYNLVKDVSSYNLIDNEDLSDNGYGNKLLVRDYWNKSFIFEDKKLDESSLLTGTNLKFDTTGEGVLRNRVNFPDYHFIEDYILTDYVEASLSSPVSTLTVGLLMNIEIPSKYDPNDSSIRSGDYLIYEITHKIDRNFDYSQHVTLIKKELYKSIF
jgi:hypothetical protein